MPTEEPVDDPDDPDDSDDPDRPQRDGHYLCDHQTQRSHKSTHPSTYGRINVIGEIECTVTMKKLEIKTYLQQRQCWWWIIGCSWDDVGDNPQSQWDRSAWWVSSLWSNRSMSCEDGRYRGRSYQFSQAPNNVVETGWTTSSSVDIEC